MPLEAPSSFGGSEQLCVMYIYIHVCVHFMILHTHIHKYIHMYTHQHTILIGAEETITCTYTYT